MEDIAIFLELCHGNDVDGVEEQIRAGFDLECRDARGRTGLHLAAIRGGLEVLRLLLEAGVDANLTDMHGNTPLHFSGHKDIIQLLIAYGANVDARNSHGDTPLTLMKRRGVCTEALQFMEIGITEMENIQGGRRIRHPSRPSRKPRGLGMLRNIWHEFCADIGVEKLIMVLMFVLCVSLYLAYTITGFAKQLDTRVPIEIESDRVEL